MDLELVVFDDKLESVCLSEFVEFANVVVHRPVVQSTESYVSMAPGEAVSDQMRYAFPLLLRECLRGCCFVKPKCLRGGRDP